MGVNNISHYNYSHTATPIHHHPTPPSLSSSLHFPSVFTPSHSSAPSLCLDYTFYFIHSPSTSLFCSSFNLLLFAKHVSSFLTTSTLAYLFQTSDLRLESGGLNLHRYTKEI